MPTWHPHPDVWLFLGGIWAAYLIAVRRRVPSSPVESRERGRRSVMFSLGMGILVLASSWPVHDLAEERLYSVHMVQHMLFTLAAAPLLVAGIPAWMWRSLLPGPMRTAFRALTRPVAAIAVFNGLLLFTHWPQVVDASVRSEPIHFVLHTLTVASAIVMWWPVMSPLPEMPSLTPPAQMMYLFAQSLAPTIPASFLTFGRTLLYPVYGDFPRIWGIPALTDQLVAGLIMKLVGGLILWGFIAVIFFNWHARERNGWDALALRHVEREVRTGVAR